MTELISVMIVDDERLTLEDFSTIIDWEACGYRIVATAFNGRQGLRKYKEFHPQLILTDIRMPFMDGIEMISEIRKNDQKTSIVLLTAYEDFGYAKAAIRLGITEYMIKSEITAESLTTLLQRLNTHIIQRDQKDMIVTDRMLEQFFLSDHLAEAPDMDQFLQRDFHILLVEQDLPVNISGETLLPEIPVPKVKTVDLLSHFAYIGWMLEAITSLSDRQIVLALSSRTDSCGDSRKALYDCAEHIRSRLRERTLRSYTVYVIDNRISLYNLKRYCDENKGVFQKKYFTGTGRVCTLEYPIASVKHTDMKSYGYGTKEWGSAQEIMELRDRKERMEQLSYRYGKITEAQDMELLLSFSRDCYYALLNAYRSLPGSPEQKAAEKALSLKNSWESWLDSAKIREWLIRQFDTYYGYLQTEVNHYSKPVMSVIEYIYRNYRNPDLSLNDIADYVHLSVGYLSGAFKKEVGITLKNYITNMRIEAAKKLMENGNYKIYEICSRVGYHSSQYFSQAFFKEVGMFPTEYVKKGKGLPK